MNLLRASFCIAGLALSLFPFSTGCRTHPATASASPSETSSPSTQIFLSTLEMPEGEFVWQQRITAAFQAPSSANDTDLESRERSFTAVVQKTKTDLTVIGLAPFGSRAFTLQQTGLDVTFTAHIQRELQFDPRNILRDIHLVYLLPTSPQTSGKGEPRTAGPFDVIDSWENGQLATRTVYKRGVNELQSMIHYSTEMQSDGPSKTVKLRNMVHSYELTIDTLTAQRISGN